MSQISKFDFDEGVLVKGKGLEGITIFSTMLIMCISDNVSFRNLCSFIEGLRVIGTTCCRS